MLQLIPGGFLKAGDAGLFTSVNITDENTGYQIDGTTILRTGTLTDFNTFVGNGAFNSDDGTYNTGIGYHAGFYNDASGGGAEGTHNVFIGYFAGQGHLGGNIGFENIAIGSSALLGCTTGFNNFALGSTSLLDLTTGSNNVAIGKNALRTMTTARYNMAIGASALQNIRGERNVAIGFSAMTGTGGGTAGGNVAIGHYAGLNQDDGVDNVVIGRQAGQSVGGNTYNNNVLIGYYSGFALLTGGDDNVFIGYKSGMNQITNSNRLIIDNQDRGSAANEAIKALIYGVFDEDPLKQKLKVNGAIASNSLTITASANDTDVSGVNTLFVNTAGVGNDIVIGGLVGGVDGQILRIAVIDNTNTTTILHVEGHNQDIYLHKGADETLSAPFYGGWVFSCNGVNWYDTGHAKHVP